MSSFILSPANKVVGAFTPHPDLPHIPLGPVLRILMLTDGDGSYDANTDFGLTELVEVLRTSNILFARVSVVTAHRDALDGTGKPTGADISSFRFDKPAHFNPAEFDEIWFFGTAAPAENPQAYAPAEQRIVAQFMDQGGGVLATGDHEDLGQPMCGWIPRVRSMRQWHFPALPPQSQWVNFYTNYVESPANSPPKFGQFRHDTLVAGHDPGYQFADQSDDIPATIQPSYFKTGGILQWRYPHPLLCSSGGVIKVMPDHMHEGECRLPSAAEVQAHFAFDGYQGTDYPANAAVGQVLPVVVAHGVITPGHSTDVPGWDTHLDPPVMPDDFPSIAAYDGHPAGVGRVVTDSTFHHFLNINLTGAGANVPDGMHLGVKGSAQWSAIKGYFRNAALWLAPARVQRDMYASVLWATRWDSQVRMQAMPSAASTHDLQDLAASGGVAQAALMRIAPPCAVLSWAGGLIAAVDPRSILLSPYLYQLLNLPDPAPELDALVPTREERLMAAFHGAVMNRLLRLGGRGREIPVDRVASLVLDEAQAAVQETTLAVQTAASRQIEQLQTLRGRLDAVGTLHTGQI